MGTTNFKKSGQGWPHREADNGQTPAEVCWGECATDILSKHVRPNLSVPC